MHPAPSLILFSTLSGLGFGLVAWLGLGAGPDGRGFALAACGLALVAAGAGLLASTAHLRRPERAWRAFSQWRSSWLSREAWLAAATMAAFGSYAILWISGVGRIAPLGGLSAALAVLTVVATAMIYAQLRTVPRWATPLTPAAFLTFAAAEGAVALAALAPGRAAVAGALLVLALAWATKLAWAIRARRTGRPAAGGGIAAATGLTGRVRLFEAPHTAPAYLTREMVFVVGRRRARALRRLSVGLGAAAPAALLIVASAVPGAATILAPVALGALLAGLLAERWLFFAQAEHVVGAYYGQG